MHLGALLRHHARYRPHHPALIFKGERIDYATFDARVNRLAHALAREGIGRGAKVAALMHNRLEMLDLFWAAAKTGVVVVPISPLLGVRAVANLLQDSDSVMVFAEGEFANLLGRIRADLPILRPSRIVICGAGEHHPQFRSFDLFVAGCADTEPRDAGVDDHDLCNILYSSGTTGEPKGIPHSHQVRAMYATLFANIWRLGPEHVMLHCGGLAYNGAFLAMLPTMFVGATFVITEEFDPGEVLELIGRERVTHLLLLAHQIVALLDHPGFTAQAVRTLDMVCALGAPLMGIHKRRFAEMLPGRFQELYSLTEGFGTVLDREDFPRKQDSVGVPPPFFELRIVDPAGRDVPPGDIGEIIGRGPLLMPGYYKRPDLTAATLVNGWLHTGDLGCVDGDGFLYLVDRKNDLIVSGGVNVYPRDIEETIAQHENVREVAVFGVPDEQWGEAPVAAVVPRQAVEPGALATWINDRVDARYQRLKDVILVDELPRNAAGKILKRQLRDAYLGENLAGDGI